MQIADSSSIWLHLRAANTKKKTADPVAGVARGGLPIMFKLTGGQAQDGRSAGNYLASVQLASIRI